MLETGKREPRLSSAARLASALGLDAADHGLLKEQTADGTATSVAAVAKSFGARRQLPADLSAFTGRDAELAAIMSAASPGRQRSARTVAVCTIQGMAGVGKTRLAVRAAHELVHAGRFTDVQLYANLRGFDPDQPPADPASVLAGLLRALDVPARRIPAEVGERAALFRDCLHGLNALVLLDDAVDEAQVRHLIPGSPTCAVLVTSRRSLAGLDATIQHRLDAFSLPEAMDLLRRITGAPRVDADPAAAVTLVEMCGRLPLAVALAASQARDRPDWDLADVVARLRNHGIDGVRAGGKSLRPVFDLSYRALPPEARCQFRLLSLHPGEELPLGAAAALADLDPSAAEPVIEQLADEHLIRYRSGRRLEVHGLLKRYAADRLAADEPAADREQALIRLLTWYLNTADAAARLVCPQRTHALAVPVAAGPLCARFADRDAAKAWLHTEYANLLAVQRCAAEHGLHGVAARVPCALREVFEESCRWDDWTASCTIAVAAAQRSRDHDLEMRLLADLGLANTLAHRRIPAPPPPGRCGKPSR